MSLIEAETVFLIAERSSIATSLMCLSDSLFADGLNPQRRLSDADFYILFWAGTGYTLDLHNLCAEIKGID